MKTTLRQVFAFLLTPLEAGSAAYGYKPSHRNVLLILGALFTLLALGVAVLAVGKALTYYFPVVVFGCLGIGALIVGSLGSDRAVAKIWGNVNSE